MPAELQITAEDILNAIVSEMRSKAEPLRTKVLVRSVYRVYLLPEDYARLRPIFSHIEDEARQELDAELRRLNGPEKPGVSKTIKRILGDGRDRKYVAPPGGWQISFQEHTDEGVEPGTITVFSTFPEGGKQQPGAGAPTVLRVKPSQPTKMAARADADTSGGSVVYARITYEDDGGPKTFFMSKDSVKIGRGAIDYHADLKLDTKADVSREHVQIRRDPSTGRFYIKDLSRFGTSVNGTAIPPRADGAADGDRNREVPLPDKATIRLADLITLEFESVRP